MAPRVTFRPCTRINSTKGTTWETELKTLERDADERLLISAAQKQPARFADLYEENFDRVYAFFARRVPTREEAQDLTAEVFHTALASIRNFRWQGAPFVSWLYGIAGHVMSAHWKKVESTRGIEESDLSDHGGGIESSVMLGKLVDALPPDQRRVIQRRFLDQKSIREIAQEFGRSEGAIKQLQLRALENLRERLGRKS